MTEMQFNLQMDRLIDTYGKGAYSKARIEALFHIVRNVEIDDFCKAVDDWILDERTAPLGEHFQAVLKRHLKKKSDEEAIRLKTGPAKCYRCADEGYVLAIRQIDLTKWAFLCPFCDAPKTLGYDRQNSAAPGEPIERTAYWRDDLSPEYLFQTPPPRAVDYSDNI